MIGPRLFAALLASAVLGAAVPASAQSTYNPDAKNLSGDSLEAEETGEDLRPLPLGCVAIAVDTAAGGEGNGRGKTLKAAEENAIELCKQSGGKNCVVEASSCNPDG